MNNAKGKGERPLRSVGSQRNFEDGPGQFHVTTRFATGNALIVPKTREKPF
jgi:hypothetical protein